MFKKTKDYNLLPSVSISDMVSVKKVPYRFWGELDMCLSDLGRKRFDVVYNLLDNCQSNTVEVFTSRAAHKSL